MLDLLPYVVVTPARNEDQFIESTIQSVVAQTVRPLKWVIVSDGSTDGTDEIVKRYAVQHEWLELIRAPERKERHFGGKVSAFDAGWARVAGLSYGVIACLDADITLERDHFEYLLGKLAADPKLGVIGTPNREVSGEIHDFRFTSVDDVSGTCQVFRRECFEAIGGYVPVRQGNIDTIAVVTARMKGWKTRTFTERVTSHQREMGTAQCGPIRASFNSGVKDHLIGNHPIWELFRSTYQMTKSPFVIRGIAFEAGYVWSSLISSSIPVSRELIDFRRSEQMDRLKQLLGMKSLVRK
jgi:glycosyltransferase involved in cell wall biosynthesis